MNFSSVGKNIKRYLSILLVTTVVLVGFPLSVYAGDPGTDLWTAKVTTKPDGYQEDDDGDVTISTAEGLAWLSKVVNGLNNLTPNRFDGKTVTLAENIDLGDHYWTPIGNTNYSPFQGTFKGGGHSISDMTVYLATTGDGELRAGLFGQVGAGGVVENVFVSGEVTTSGSGNNYAGGIVGRSDGGEVINCSFEGNVTASGDGNNRGGGIAGYNQNGVVSGCSVANTLVTASFVEGTVPSTRKNNLAGGVLGYSSSDKVSDCSFEGVVIASGNYQNIAGGIVGSSNKSEVSNCSSAGNITAIDGKKVEGWGSSNSAGGVVGSTQNGGEVTNCRFNGKVTATKSTDNYAG